MKLNWQNSTHFPRKYNTKSFLTFCEEFKYPSCCFTLLASRPITPHLRHTILRTIIISNKIIIVRDDEQISNSFYYMAFPFNYHTRGDGILIDTAMKQLSWRKYIGFWWTWDCLWNRLLKCTGTSGTTHPGRYSLPNWASFRSGYPQKHEHKARKFVRI